MHTGSVIDELISRVELAEEHALFAALPRMMPATQRQAAYGWYPLPQHSNTFEEVEVA